ncbi:ketoacyl-ACP synthase III family protein [Saccharopolyspora sp. NPDC047091]|uniref:ketoacyl-ACP synthase III family protein n=1 Tax=Saccharopolyspora sp. NPDC047091 TaxID=3155924 RepID=UPI00340B646B
MSAPARTWLSGLSEWLPPTSVPVAQAVAEARLEPAEAAATGYAALPVSHDLAAPEMAVRAARDGLARAGFAAADIGFLAHAWTYHQGHDFWSPAHYIAARIGADGANPVGVQQMCNGGAAALELATRWVGAAEAGTALVTTADRFAEPGFDRWRGDYGLWYGDGAAAVLVGRGTDGSSADLELLALASRAEPAAEEMHRGADPFSAAPLGRVDVRRTKKAYLSRHGRTRFAEITAVRVPEVVRAALLAAEVDAGDPRLRCVLLPRLGERALGEAYHPALRAVFTDLPALDLGADTGHLGAGDLLSNLVALARPGALAAGELAAVLSAGGGFTWSCAIVRKPAPADHERENHHVR